MNYLHESHILVKQRVGREYVIPRDIVRRKDSSTSLHISDVSVSIIFLHTSIQRGNIPIEQPLHFHYLTSEKFVFHALICALEYRNSNECGARAARWRYADGSSCSVSGMVIRVCSFGGGGGSIAARR